MVDTHPYTLAALRRATGLTRHAIERLVQVGFVKPVSGQDHAPRFSFSDVVALRSAQSLRGGGISTRKMLSALERLQTRWPQAGDASRRIRIGLAGQRITARTDAGTWEVETGQQLLDLTHPTGSVGAAALPTAHGPVAVPDDSAEAMLQAAESLEEDDPTRAQAAYRALLARWPRHAHAYLNLGFLLCESGRFAEAVSLYEGAVLLCPDEPLMHYNRGVALTAVQRLAEAVASYETCLSQAPGLADAHQNLALVCAELGDTQKAIRHFNTYRRMMAG